MSYEIKTLSLIVKPEIDQIFSEMATTVRMVDEGAGPFVEVEQVGRAGIGKICIAEEEWPVLKEAIDRMIAACGDA